MRFLRFLKAEFRNITRITRFNVKLRQVGNVIAQLAVPFYANVHIAGDHNHACLYYLCATQSDHVMLSKESTGYRWVTPAELADARDIPQDVKSIGTLAFETYKEKQSR